MTRKEKKKKVKIRFDEKGNAKCPRCNGDLEWHYNRCQILCYMCKCGFEYPVKKEQFKLWKYGEGWWNKWDNKGNKKRGK